MTFEFCGLGFEFWVLAATRVRFVALKTGPSWIGVGAGEYICKFEGICKISKINQMDFVDMLQIWSVTL